MKMKKLISATAALAMACAIFGGTAAYAAEIPDDAAVAGMVGVDLEEPMSEEELANFNAALQEQQASGVVPYGTVTGDAGSSWINLECISSKKSQASFGCDCTKTMIALNYSLLYAGAGGGSHSGVAALLGKDWSGEHVKDHTSSGTCTVTLTASAFTTDMSLVYTLAPTDVAYIR